MLFQPLSITFIILILAVIPDVAKRRSGSCCILIYLCFIQVLVLALAIQRLFKAFTLFQPLSIVSIIQNLAVIPDVAKRRSGIPIYELAVRWCFSYQGINWDPRFRGSDGRREGERR